MNRNIFKYFAVGGICTALDLSVFFVFAKLLGFHYILVSSVGFTLAVFLNYFLCVKFIFTSGSRFTKRTEIVFIYIVSSLGLCFNQLVLYGFVGILGFEIVFSKVLATAIVFFWNYFSRSSYIFSRR